MQLYVSIYDYRKEDTTLFSFFFHDEMIGRMYFLWIKKKIFIKNIYKCVKRLV
jgi:hypothetical protein